MNNSTQDQIDKIIDAATDTRDRVIRLEGKIDNVVEKIDKHILIDSKRLDLAENRIGKLEKYLYMGLGIIAFIGLVVTCLAAMKH